MKCGARKGGVRRAKPAGSPRLVGGFAGHVAVADHAAQRGGAPQAGAFRRDQRVRPGGRAGESGQQRRLAEREVRGGPVEVEGRGGRDAHRALAQRDAIEVLLEDLLFGEVVLQAHGPQRLAHLGKPAAPGASQQAGQLHGDGRGTRDDADAAHVLERRPRRGAQVHAAVPVEAPVLQRNERLDELRIGLGQRNPAGQTAVGGAGGAQRQPEAVGNRQALHRLGVGQTVRQRPQNPGDRAGRCNGQRQPQGQQDPTAPGHRPAARRVTVNTPPSLRPCTAGLYISSAWAGGRMKMPGVVARAM